MTPEQQEDMEAAMLAGMVKGKMRSIDSLMESRPDIPADRINLNTFVEKIKTKGNNSENSHPINIQQNDTIPFEVNTPTGIEKISTNAISIDESIKNDIVDIKLSLEKINNNLTKLCGMFGKVFHNLTKK
jgi:hypothetical protein